MDEKPHWAALRAFLARLEAAGLSPERAQELAREARELHARRIRCKQYALAAGGISEAEADRIAARELGAPKAA